MRKLIILAVVGIGAVVAGVVAYRRATGGDRLREEIAAYAAFDTPLPGDLFVADAGCGRVYGGSEADPGCWESAEADTQFGKVCRLFEYDELYRIPRQVREELLRAPGWTCKARVIRNMLMCWVDGAPLEDYEPAMLERLARDGDRRVRLILVAALDFVTGGSHSHAHGCGLVYGRCMPVLPWLIEDPDPEVRKYAACTVRRLGLRELVGPLRRAALDGCFPVASRLQAAMAWHWAVTGEVPPLELDDAALLRCIVTLIRSRDTAPGTGESDDR